MVRLAVSFALGSAWLMLLLTGSGPAWLAFVLLGAAAVTFPWSLLSQGADSSSGE